MCICVVTFLVAIWAGTTVLVGFVIGTVAFKEELANVPVVIGGVVVLVLGIVSISLVPDYLMRRANGGKESDKVHRFEKYDESKWNSGVHERGVSRDVIHGQSPLSNGQVQGSVANSEQAKLLDSAGYVVFNN